MDYQHIRFEQQDNILIIHLHRPDRLNAFTIQMRDELIDALDKADMDDTIRAIIITGEGRAFCAGMELEQNENKDNIFGYDLKAGEPWDMAKLRDSGGTLTLRMYDCKKPIIGAINGAAVGIGITMTLAMDYRLASEKTKFGFVFAQRGLVPEACSSWFLPRLVGISKALHWVYSGDIFTAGDGLKAGLFQEVTEPENLLQRAIEFAHSLTQKSSPVSVALARQMMWKMLGADHPMEAHKVDSRFMVVSSESTDGKEGINSFFEKRPPEFSNKVSEDLSDYYPFWEQREFK